MTENNFWQELKKAGRPILALAPLAGFTDSAFRQICRPLGADVLYSEMVSATALFYNQEIKNNKTLELAAFNRDKEKFYVVQLFGSDPDHFAVAARIISQEIKPDGIDINFGCPVGKILKQGAGADLMKDLDKARAVIKAVLDNTDRPLSLKLRLQSGPVSALDFVAAIADLPVAALMIHGRSLAQGFAGQPDFSVFKKIRLLFSGVLLANGGINDLASAQRALAESEADGLGLARGALGRPWLFAEIRNNKQTDYSLAELSRLMLEHAILVDQLKGQSGMIELRKHLPWYVQGYPDASRWRERLVRISSLDELKSILADMEKTI